MITQHDLIFKQMDRQRAELYQRMQDRIQRAKQLGHICKDQINYLKSKIMDLEERINEANNEHFNKHVLQIDPKTAIDSLSAILSDDEDITELNRSKISDKSLNSSLFSDSKHNLDE
ncbi:predicted protein [Naegleria gruberi]|uniref:Predicted protein n=1 Tax=Naegleria gruberi TaxID=5762 RepID=D2VFK4_NAEGR|nr:uncharacterized protein NAEGRDRAFT_49128 [Naegleria gruberi]EFC44375.1 predicted protein [Naegleria gruberi]|eukprot:XP_002677119.1 predicted protein [Naegleria gruberi strain NEG-M]